MIGKSPKLNLLKDSAGTIGLPIIVMIYLILIITIITGQIIGDAALMQTVNAHDDIRQRSVEHQGLRQIVKESALQIMEVDQNFVPIAAGGRARARTDVRDQIRTRLGALNTAGGGLDIALMGNIGGQAPPIHRFFPTVRARNLGAGGATLANGITASNPGNVAQVIRRDAAGINENSIRVLPNGTTSSSIGGGMLAILTRSAHATYGATSTALFSRAGVQDLYPQITVRYHQIPVTSQNIVAYSLPATNPVGRLRTLANTLSGDYLAANLSGAGGQILPGFSGLVDNSLGGGLGGADFNISGYNIMGIGGFADPEISAIDATALRDSDGRLVLADQGFDQANSVLPYRYRDQLTLSGNIYEHIFASNRVVPTTGGGVTGITTGFLSGVVNTAADPTREDCVTFDFTDPEAIANLPNGMVGGVQYVGPTEEDIRLTRTVLSNDDTLNVTSSADWVAASQMVTIDDDNNPETEEVPSPRNLEIPPVLTIGLDQVRYPNSSPGTGHIYSLYINAATFNGLADAAVINITGSVPGGGRRGTFNQPLLVYINYPEPRPANPEPDPRAPRNPPEVPGLFNLTVNVGERCWGCCQTSPLYYPATPDAQC